MDKLILNIDSRFRDAAKYPSSAYFVHHLPAPLRDVMSISLLSVEFPNVYYQISAVRGNHRFRVNDAFDVILTDGNYDLFALLQNIALQLFANLPDIQLNVGATDSRVTFSSETEFLTFDFGAVDPQIYPTLGQLLGFAKARYADTRKVQAECVPLVNPETYFFLRINDYGKVGGMPFLDERRVFAKIVNAASKNNVLYYQTQNAVTPTATQLPSLVDNTVSFCNATFDFRQPQNLFRLEIEILDMFGNRLDLMNANFSLTLEVHFIVGGATKHDYEQQRIFRI